MVGEGGRTGSVERILERDRPSDFNRSKGVASRNQRIKARNRTRRKVLTGSAGPQRLPLAPGDGNISSAFASHAAYQVGGTSIRDPLFSLCSMSESHSSKPQAGTSD